MIQLALHTPAPHPLHLYPAPAQAELAGSLDAKAAELDAQITNQQALREMLDKAQVCRAGFLDGRATYCGALGWPGKHLVLTAFASLPAPLPAPTSLQAELVTHAEEVATLHCQLDSVHVKLTATTKKLTDVEASYNAKHKRANERNAKVGVT